MLIVGSIVHIIGVSLSEPHLVRSMPALSIYYDISYNRHLLKAHAYNLNSKAARGKHIEVHHIEVQKSTCVQTARPPVAASHHELRAENRSKAEP